MNPPFFALDLNSKGKLTTVPFTFFFSKSNIKKRQLYRLFPFDETLLLLLSKFGIIKRELKMKESGLRAIKPFDQLHPNPKSIFTHVDETWDACNMNFMGACWQFHFLMGGVKAKTP